MTREEAVELLCYGDWLNVISEHIGKTDAEKIAEAMSIVGKTLRPVSREQVERVRGEWINTNKEVEQMCKCSKCGYPISYFWSRTPFCPNCGAPMTDEAVKMVMERLEEMKNG